MTRYSASWTGHGNLGDEAMRAAYDRVFGAHPVPVLAGGTLINRGDGVLDAYAAACGASGHSLPTFGTGVADPAFWRDRGGWHNRLAEWAAILKDLPGVGVRGPRSAAMLQDAGVPAHVVGDPALVFWRYRDETRPATGNVGLNVGLSGGDVWGDENDIERACIDLAQRMEAHGLHVTVFPAWTDDVPACQRVAYACKHANLSPHTTDAERFIASLEHIDVMVGMKLHACVLAACANVPFVALEYRPKCRDFCESLDWGHCVRTDALDPAELCGRAIGLMDTLEENRRWLSTRVVTLSDRFRRYCATL